MGRRCFSDRMLGYSPMAPTSQSDQSAKMPSAQDVTTAGGVWAPTSAKRDKIAELTLALNEGQKTLDDAATPDQKLDLYLADGLRLIAKAVEREAGDSAALNEVEVWMDEKAKELPTDLQKANWEAYLQEVSNKASSLAATYQIERCLRYVRDFYERSPDDGVAELEGDMTGVEEAFEACVNVHRLGLLQAAADDLLGSWDTLTRVSDADIDRAAVQGIELDPQAPALPLSKLNNVLLTFVGGTCVDRVASLWSLMDRDGDGLLDSSEMDKVAYLTTAPVETSLQALFQDSLQAYPVRAPLAYLSLDSHAMSSSKSGWRQRRREKRIRERLLRIFQNTIKTHFVDEVEMAHRLRCIYAWADKEHQGNRIDSIQVEASEWGGRRRYVELEPKISLQEFREVQIVHFPHLDRIEQEILTGFRENLLVDQGKGRQNRELQRDCLLFLTVVSAIDFIIVSL